MLAIQSLVSQGKANGNVTPQFEKWVAEAWAAIFDEKLCTANPN